MPNPQNQVYENDEEQKQAPEHHTSQAMCVNMPNDEPEGHYWSWVNAPQSAPNQYRECMSCGRIDATEWLASRDKQIALAAQQNFAEHILFTPTEGTFFGSELFIKRAPIEQAIVDKIGYEAFIAIKESIPPANQETENNHE